MWYCGSTDSDSEDDILPIQVCPKCGPSGGIDASDDGNRDQSCGTCGMVLLIDGKPVKPGTKYVDLLTGKLKA